jgi:hypothetical protein
MDEFLGMWSLHITHCDRIYEYTSVGRCSHDLTTTHYILDVSQLLLLKPINLFISLMLGASDRDEALEGSERHERAYAA